MVPSVCYLLLNDKNSLVCRGCDKPISVRPFMDQRIKEDARPIYSLDSIRRISQQLGLLSFFEVEILGHAHTIIIIILDFNFTLWFYFRHQPFCCDQQTSRAGYKGSLYSVTCLTHDSILSSYYEVLQSFLLVFSMSPFSCL